MIEDLVQPVVEDLMEPVLEPVVPVMEAVSPGPGPEPAPAAHIVATPHELPQPVPGPVLDTPASPASSPARQRAGGPASRSSHVAHRTTAASALPCTAAAAIYNLTLKSVPDSASGSGDSEAPSLPSPSTCGGTGGGSGAAFRTFFADLVTLAAFAAQPFNRRVHHASAPWRPAAFVAVIERPG
jgi:hypothetical protein